MQTATHLFLCAFFLFLASCSGGGGSGSGISGATDRTLFNCDSVITDAKIKSFNQKQTAFSVEAGGGSVACKSEINENGRVRKVEAEGRTVLRIRPGLKYLRTENPAGRKPYTVYFEKVIPSEEDARSILSQMGLPLIGGASPNFQIDHSNSPAYVRFGRGSIFYVNNATTMEIDQKENLVFGIIAENHHANQLSTGMQNFLQGSAPLELLWYPRNGQLARQIAQENQTSVAWSNLTGEETVISLVRDQTRASSQVITEAIDLVMWWNLDIKLIHQELPELYNFSMEQWQSPLIADNTASDLVDQLRYIVKVNPASPLKATLESYELINKYHDSTSASLEAAVEFVSGKLWTQDQFQLLVDTAENLYGSLGSRSWKSAQAINLRTGYNRTVSIFAAQAGMMLKKRSLVQDSDPASFVEAVFAKIQAGLSAANLDFYFRTFDYFETELRANRTDAESACDELVFGQKLTTSNQSLYFSFFKWLKEKAFVDFDEAYAVVQSLSANQSLDTSRVEIFKQVFTWLKDSVYLNRSVALEKAGLFAGKINFNQAVFNQFKSYYDWLTNTVYLSRSEALQRAEDTLVTAGLGAVQVDSIKSLTTWYINQIYLSREEALTRVESLIVTKKISPDQITVMKDAVSWLISAMYLSRTDAAEKGESFVTSPKPFTSAVFQRLKDYTSWLMSAVYLSRTDALEKGEELIINLAASDAQVSVLKNAVTWLISDVYLSRPNAFEKGENYVTAKNLTAQLFAALKQEYNAQIRLNKSRSEALRIAEEKILK